MVGDEASQLRSMLDVTYPMENGIVRFVFEKKKPLKNYFFITYKHKKYLLIEIGMTCAMYGIILLDQRR